MDSTFLILAIFFNGILSLFGAYVAGEKGRSAGLFWLLGFLFSFFIVLLVAIGVPRVDHPSPSSTVKNSHKKCHACKEDILEDAVMCRYCGSEQEELEPPQAVRSWCPSCKSESNVPPHAACAKCGRNTHPWE